MAGEIAEEPRIDVLINNAGAVFNARKETQDGLERTFALNHMSYFVITNLLLSKLKSGARIVSTASGAHQRAKLNFDDLRDRRRLVLQGFPVYLVPSSATSCSPAELAKRIAGTGVTANCLHPGFVATRFGDESGGLLSAGVRAAKLLGAISSEDGAKTITYLAAAPEVADVSGEYFYECKIETPSPAARNVADGEKLWNASVQISGVGR